MKTVLVTGSTGKIGSQLVPRLVAYEGIAVRALAQNAEKAAPLAAAGAELALGAFEDAPAIRAAVDGADTLVLITPANPDAADRAGLVLEAAKAAGVQKIARVSVFKAAVDGPTAVTRLHGRTDAEIQASGLRYVILRPPFFMQNLFFTAVTSIASMGGLFFGTRDGKIGMLDLRDIVDCAEQSAVRDTYDNQIFTLTGPEAISFHDIADRLTAILERPIQYVPVPPESVEQSIRALGMGAWFARVMRDLCAAYSEHWGDITMGDVAHLSGHAPRSFDAFARELLAPVLVPAG
jgi:uncharacterized protein YbjT (DUF2867 family)